MAMTESGPDAQPKFEDQPNSPVFGSVAAAMGKFRQLEQQVSQEPTREAQRDDPREPSSVDRLTIAVNILRSAIDDNTEHLRWLRETLLDTIDRRERSLSVPKEVPTPPVDEVGSVHPALTGLNFSAALYYLKAGRRVARKSYWPIVMWLVLRGTDTPAFRIRTSEGHTLPWVPSQTDLLADDWYIVE